MASAKLTLPFVVTLAAASIACSGTAVVTDDDGGGGSGAASSASNGSTSSGNTSISASATGNPNDCPAEAPGPYEKCSPTGTVCNYDVACQSGTVALQFSCGDFAWELVPSACDQPHDSCPGTEYHCANGWTMPVATNPPSPCPNAPPTAGEACFAGGMGGVWEDCGYYCDDTAGAAWTVAHCPASPTPTEAVWVYDDACEAL